jgi:hypothetical protein
MNIPAILKAYTLAVKPGFTKIGGKTSKKTLKNENAVLIA